MNLKPSGAVPRKAGWAKAGAAASNSAAAAMCRRNMDNSCLSDPVLEKHELQLLSRGRVEDVRNAGRNLDIVAGLEGLRRRAGKLTATGLAVYSRAGAGQGAAIGDTALTRQDRDVIDPMGVEFDQIAVIHPLHELDPVILMVVDDMAGIDPAAFRRHQGLVQLLGRLEFETIRRRGAQWSLGDSGHRRKQGGGEQKSAH